jgi:hypothetical protein
LETRPEKFALSLYLVELTIVGIAQTVVFLRRLDSTKVN